MEFSAQQDKALVTVSEWLTDPSQQVCYLAGYAGTGKTTLAQHFAQHVDGRVLFAAFTGKAAHVLKQKGCPDASTIHHLIYRSKEKSRLKLQKLESDLVKLIANTLEDEIEPVEAGHIRQLIEYERKNLAKPVFDLDESSIVRTAELVVIDECSTVDGRMGQDLLSFGTKILVLGDPAQLPPIGGGGFFTDREPDIMLTEIHRQARDNPIIDLATRTRNKELIPLGAYGSSRIITKASVEEAAAMNQILVGKNVTRKRLNRRLRDINGITEAHPVAGDRLVCLRNNHDTGLLNGAIWFVEDTGSYDDSIVTMTIRPENGSDSIVVDAHTGHFVDEWDVGMSWSERKLAEEFDFGYALTVHKAQGSQWDSVLLYDESGCFRENKWRWLYTGITRAAEEIVMVRT